ncbi:ADP-ribosyltransferase exoenzyme [compost metagenome]
MSTSLSMKAAEQFQSEQDDAYFIRILAPVGTRGLNVERVSSFGEEEREVLLARGQRLKVVSYDHATRTITARIFAHRP